ncbi:uncharacterized protein PAC_17298 [Phialocephala subalpina]|uniref:Uncharacterized protein n=1 Tax=Phialocephala subalpina TaxID=576137 RepID=A0A1L7XQW6_9HELO|nr:uncharacterized protein PAC_17298 [Phialocephala subalpina]
MDQAAYDFGVGLTQELYEAFRGCPFMQPLSTFEKSNSSSSNEIRWNGMNNGRNLTLEPKTRSSMLRAARLICGLVVCSPLASTTAIGIDFDLRCSASSSAMAFNA